MLTPAAACRALLVLVLVASVAALGGCAQPLCTLNSDCPTHSRCEANACVSDCTQDRDCPASTPFCDLNGRCVATATDGGTDADTGTDVTMTDTRDVVVRDMPIVQPDIPVVVDTFVPPPDVPVVVDTFVPPPDVQVLRAYLDPCGASTDCASGLCATGSIQFCTRTCVVDTDCADGQRCSHGACRLDDTGTTGCDLTSGSPCLDYCYGSSTVASARQCTHACTSQSDCPAGFACSNVGAARVCVNIELNCTTADQCPSGLGFCGAGGVGCTAACTSAADCPAEVAGVPAYTCEVRGTATVCVPPTTVLGGDPIGTSCPATGTNTCRSEACDTDLTPPVCTQQCTTQGGCGPGYGCFPIVSGSTVQLACIPAGAGWLGATCGHARDCYSGLCSTSGYCTRLCDDGICPTGMTCMNSGLTTAAGTPISLCSR